MEITAADEARVVAWLISDVAVTLGGGHEESIRRDSSHYRTFFNEPDSIDVSSDEYIERVVETVQQDFHDAFIDITWPACPLHHRHPLWLHAGYWTCEQLGIPLAKLGELRASRDATGGYVILADRAS